VHARITFEDGSALWFDDPRRFGLLRAVATATRFEDPALAILGPDPVLDPPDGERLMTLARGAKIAIKLFLLDQKRLAGVGNIYASEVLFRAGVDPRRRAGAITRAEWDAIAREIIAVLGEAIDRMGTTFSMYRTLWNEPGNYGERLLVYDRAGEPCRTCGTPVRRIVQGARSTFFCPSCQRRVGRAGPSAGRAASTATRLAPASPARRVASPARRGKPGRKSRDFAQNRAR
jgi:formamidopyrimidine-DNA glycosylase